MNRLFIAIMAYGTLCFPMYARDYSRAEIYGGYQLIHDDQMIEDITYSDGSVLDQYKNLNGFNAALEYNLRSWIGIVGEVSHGRSSPVIENMIEFAPYPQLRFEYKRNQTPFLFGPRFSYRQGRFRFFGHALFGGNHVDRGINSISTYQDGSTKTAESGQSYTGFATAFGGGLDFSLGKHLSVRPAQLDLLSTYRSYDTHHIEYNQYQFRYSAGVVVNLRPAKR